MPKHNVAVVLVAMLALALAVVACDGAPEKADQAAPSPDPVDATAQPQTQVAQNAASPVSASADEDGVAVRPYYIGEDGIGILRYSAPDGGPRKYGLTIQALTGKPERPREVITNTMAAYTGPDIAVYIGSLFDLRIPLEQLEIELYQADPLKAVLRFRPEIDPEKAEGLDDCGTLGDGGACSNL